MPWMVPITTPVATEITRVPTTMVPTGRPPRVNTGSGAWAGASVATVTLRSAARAVAIKTVFMNSGPVTE